MGYIDDKGDWQPWGSSPVKGAYWVFTNEEGLVVTADGFVLPPGMTIQEYQDKLVRDMMISSAVPTSIPPSQS